jgi:two-component system phosphate regulon response regulator PhoB
MAVVNIFTTTTLEDAGDFVHNGNTFTFARVGAEGPRRMIEGQAYLFLDWAMPGISGLEVCRRLRADNLTGQSHITMVLEEDDPDDRRRALKAGADDYMVGPLLRSSVLDRVLALHAQPQQSYSQNSVVAGDLVIDLLALRARWGGKVIELSPNEFRLLRFLAERPNVVHSRAQIIEGLGKADKAISERAVDVWMKRLRAALGEVGQDEALRTVRPLGYCLEV